MDEFGWSVAVTSSSQGTYAAIGASDNNSGFDVVYVYVLSHGKWRRQAALPDPGQSGSDNFGVAVAITSTMLVVGAPCVNNEDGKFYVYLRFDQGWILAGGALNPANQPHTWFGQSLSVSGKNILVGEVDKAYMFTETPRQTLRRTATIQNPSSAADNFGWEVALSGSTAVVTAPGGVSETIISSPLSAGEVYVYKPKGRTWSLRQKVRVPAGAKGDQFGYSVSLESNFMLIGMPLYGSAGCGTAFEFAFSGSRWSARTQIKNQQCSKNAQFGFAVAKSGKSGVFGAPNSHARKGAAYLRKVS